MSSELEQERELAEIMRRFEGTVLPQLQNARASMAIYSGVCDARLALEVGASILLNKPLLVAVVKDASIPMKLLAVADEIVKLDGEVQAPENVEKLTAGVKRLLARRPPE